jgi:hypothetical protein
MSALLCSLLQPLARITRILSQITALHRSLSHYTADSRESNNLAWRDAKPKAGLVAQALACVLRRIISPPEHLPITPLGGS